MSEQKIALVTGANKGIGRQIATELADENIHVLIGSRDLSKGKAVAAEIGSNAQAIEIDVTEPTTIAEAAQTIERAFGRLDILVNNAGISHAGPPGTPFDELLARTRMSSIGLDELKTIFDVNVMGIVAVTQAMLPLLRRSPDARIVNISSGAGSFGLQDRPDNPAKEKFGAYSVSKAAVNAVTLAFAFDLEKEGIKVNAACPGFTSTDLNNFEGRQTVAEAARRPVELALIGPDGPSGTLSNSEGFLPW